MPFFKSNNITLRTAKQRAIAIHQTKEPSQKNNRAGSSLAALKKKRGESSFLPTSAHLTTEPATQLTTLCMAFTSSAGSAVLLTVIVTVQVLTIYSIIILIIYC